MNYRTNYKRYLTAATLDKISCPRVLENGLYEQTTDRHKVIFVNDLDRDRIYHDFFKKMEE